VTRDELLRLIASARTLVPEAALAYQMAFALLRGLDAMRDIVESGRTVVGEVRDSDVGPLAVRNLDDDVPAERALNAAIAKATFAFSLMYEPDGVAQAIQRDQARLNDVRAQRHRDDQST